MGETAVKRSELQRRTPLRAKSPMRRTRSRKTSDRQNRSASWLDAVRSLGTCVRCGAYGVQAAHVNEGKGIGQKVPDCFTAALCHACHHAIDNGNTLDRETRRAEMDRAFRATLRRLFTEGVIGVL